jgi:protein ImuA
MSRFVHNLAALRHRIALIDPGSSVRARAVFPRQVFSLGLDNVDARLGGGLERGALHEVFAGSEEDAGAAAAFALILGLRGGEGAKPILWVRDDRAVRNTGGLYGLGLSELGADPARFVLVSAPDELSTLRAAADIVKCGAVGAVVIEPYGKAGLLDLTASRRLALASATSGVLAVVLRVGAEPSASAAQTRWLVTAAPSTPVAANAPGSLALTIALLRHRGGIAAFETCLEWNREQAIFAAQTRVAPALSGGISAAAVFAEDHARAA